MLPFPAIHLLAFLYFGACMEPITVQQPLVSSQPSFSRFGIVQTLRDLPSVLGLRNGRDFGPPKQNAYLISYFKRELSLMHGTGDYPLSPICFTPQTDMFRRKYHSAVYR